MDGPMLVTSGAACMAGGGGGGGRSHPAMDPRVSTGRVISPIGFEATMSVAMQLEKELKAKNVFTDPRESEAPGVEGQQHATNGRITGGKEEEEVSKEGGRMDDESPSLAMEELMEEDDDEEEEELGSLCPSTNGSYDGDASLGMHSVDNYKDDDADPLRRSHGCAPERNGRTRVNGLNGSVGPDSSEGDYYEGSDSSRHHVFARQPPQAGEGGGDEGDEARRQSVQCHLCPFTGNSKYQLNAHLNSHYDHKCNHCDYTSRTEGRLKRHVKDFHSELQSPEDFSTVKSGQGEGDTNGGNNAQSKVKLYRCKQCSYVATVKTDFWDHSKSHIKMEKLLTCPKCPFVTEYKHHLEYHLRNHFGSKPFKCPKCNYSCVNKSMLNSHMKSHSNIYQYRCANCTYATKYCHSLKLHLRKYAHTPSTVLNPDGTPNPVPVIDVYGTRRGPRTKKSSQQDELYGNSGSNDLVAFALASNGALSPSSAALPFFYQGGGATPNGFHSTPDGGHPRPRNPSHSPAAGPTGSRCSAEDDGKQSPGSRPDPFECGLCDFSTEHRDTFSKHMLLHAAAENQDLCNLYGISSDNLLLQESNQQQMDAASAVAVATALGLNPSQQQQQQAHRAELFRQHAFNLLQIQNGQDLGQHYNPQKGSNHGPLKETLKPSKEENEKAPSSSSSLLPNPLDHLRAFSEQVNVKPFMMREFSSSLFASTPLSAQNPTPCSSPPPSVAPEKQRVSPSHNGTHVKATPSDHPKGGRRGAARPTGDGLPSLGPLDLSSAKGVPHTSFSHQLLMQNPFQQQLHQFYPLPATFLQQQQQQRSGAQDALEISTDALQQQQPSEAYVSPTQGKNRRKGRAFKLDRICMKLQKERDSPPLGPADDSAEEDEGSKGSDLEEEEGGRERKRCSNGVDPSEAEDKGEFGDKVRPPEEPGCKAPMGFREGAREGVRDAWNEAYQCPYCDMAFRDCVMYTVHMGYHGFKDPFKCNMCGQQTNDKVAFFLHIARTAHL